MKTLPLALFLATLQPLSAQQSLTPSDREILLERLEKIREDADAKVDARFRAATNAFKNAASSPKAAFELYLKCEELINFGEMKRKNADFREWKKNNDARLSSPGFHLALQQQLLWLILTLEAASENPDHDQLAIEAAKIVNTIVTQAEYLSDHRNMLLQGVTSSNFARAYDINALKVKNWPFSPVPIASVYERVILPPLRRADRIESLKAKWTQRMSDEGTLIQAWSDQSHSKSKTGEQSPAFEKFVSETLPSLKWNAETDFFQAGDERAAAIRMLKHIEDHLAHQSAPKWTENFMKMLESKERPQSDQ